MYNTRNIGLPSAEVICATMNEHGGLRLDPGCQNINFAQNSIILTSYWFSFWDCILGTDSKEAQSSHCATVHHVLKDLKSKRPDRKVQLLTVSCMR